MRARGTNLFAALAVALGVATAPRGTRACSPVPPKWPRLSELVFEDESIDIESERIDLRCMERDRDAACTFAITARVRGREPGRRSTKVFVLTSPVVTSVVVASPATTSAGPVPMPDIILAPSPRDDDARMFLRRAFAFDVVVPASETREIIVTAAFTMQRFVDPCVDEGIDARHALFAHGRRHGDFELAFFHSLGGRRHSRRHVDVHVAWPVDWDAGVGALRDDPVGASPAAVVTRREPGDLDGRVDAEGGTAVVVDLSVPRSVAWAGGPFAGASYAFAPAADGHLRLRLGYEIAAPVWLVHSVALETDAQRLLAIVPAMEVITTSSPMSPLVFGGGIAVPIRARPEARAGARVGASASYEWVTIRGGLDVYPPTTDSDTAIEGWLGAQLSL